VTIATEAALAAQVRATGWYLYRPPTLSTSSWSSSHTTAGTTPSVYLPLVLVFITHFVISVFACNAAPYRPKHSSSLATRIPVVIEERQCVAPWWHHLTAASLHKQSFQTLAVLLTTCWFNRCCWHCRFCRHYIIHLHSIHSIDLQTVTVITSRDVHNSSRHRPWGQESPGFQNGASADVL